MKLHAKVIIAMVANACPNAVLFKFMTSEDRQAAL
jgi:hypothetical protein